MDLNRKNMQKIAMLIAFAILLNVGLQKYELFFSAVRTLLHLVMPFIIGGALAFILNVPMRFLETKLFPRRYGRKPNPLYRMRRLLSLVLTFAFVVAVLCVLALMVVPEMARSVLTIGERIPAFFNQLMEYVDSLSRQYPEFFAEIESFFADLGSNRLEIHHAKNMGFLHKQKCARQHLQCCFHHHWHIHEFRHRSGLRHLSAAAKRKTRRSVQARAVFVRSGNQSRLFSGNLSAFEQHFFKFISGQCLEACILGLMFFVSMSLLHMPYAMIISMLIGVTALIPIFGAFIGCGVGVFLILIVSPIQAVWFLVLFLVMQQIEGNLVYPHVVGNSVGLPSIWVLMAVSLGASTMGVLGMIINIPLFSIVYALLRQTVRRRLHERGIDRSKLR